jgi:hypothetical protein
MIAPVVMWIDPGGLSGIARLERGREFSACEWPFMEACRIIVGCCAQYRQSLAVGWERYRIDVHRPQDDAYDAIGVSRVADWAAHTWGCQVLQPQDPGDRKVASPQLVQALGWWRPGEKDANAASQHLAAYLMRLPPGHVPSDLSVKLSAARHPGR